jgi:hypothetical protein
MSCRLFLHGSCLENEAAGSPPPPSLTPAAAAARVKEARAIYLHFSGLSPSSLAEEKNSSPSSAAMTENNNLRLFTLPNEVAGETAEGKDAGKIAPAFEGSFGRCAASTEGNHCPRTSERAL